MIPDRADLWLLPLGGCGEIGMNLNLYGHDQSWIMVDCGVTFEDPHEARLAGRRQKRLAPDIRFIRERREHLLAILITHAHEDHVGALADLWPELRCPVYATPFTSAIIRRKLGEKGLLNQVTLHELPVGGHCRVGPFSVEWIHLSHSIPEPSALLIRTPAGQIFHTADWKLDANPVVGQSYDRQRLKQLGKESIDAMVCDSTNAPHAGWSVSEAALRPGLARCLQEAPGRVIVTCFGSNIARLVTVASLGPVTGRYVGLMGRSLHNMRRAASQTGYWPSDCPLVESSHLGYLPRQEVLGIATGSQGETGSALWRLSRNQHPDLTLEAGDRVVFSSRIIPGNEEEVERLMRSLKAIGVEIITEENSPGPIHASGHPCADELTQLYQWVKPQLVVPVHGEERHMQANALIARDSGVPRQVTGRNGDLFRLCPQPGVLREAAPVGRVPLNSD